MQDLPKIKYRNPESRRDHLEYWAQMGIKYSNGSDNRM
jgi:hypothetical protein